MRQRFVPLYYLAFALYCSVYWLNTTTFNELPGVNIDLLYVYIRIFCVAILFIKVLLEEFLLKEYLIYAFLFVIFLISAIVSGSWNLLLLLLFVLAGSGIKVDRLANIVLAVVSTITSLAVACSLLGLIDMRVLPSGNNFRLSYGFIHPNQFGLSLLTICMAIAVIRFKRFHLPEIVLGMSCFVLAYFLAVSRTSSICILVVVVLSIICTSDKDRKLDSLILRCGTVLFVCLQCLSLYLMVYYNSSKPWMSYLDNLVSRRLDLMHHFYITYPHGLWGYDFDSLNEVWYSYFKGFIVDNGFAHAFLESGYVVELIVFICWFAVLCIACRKRVLDASVFGLLVYGFVAFTEASSFFIIVNFSLISLNHLTKIEKVD